MKKSTKIVDLGVNKLLTAEEFHELTKNRELSPHDGKYPESWIKIHFKTYPRLERIRLALKRNKGSLFKAMASRESIRRFSKEPISFNNLSYILFGSSGIIRSNESIDKNRRSYPSAGARYPIEIYIASLNIENLNKGLYHYNVKRNELEVLLKEDLERWVLKSFGDEKWLTEAGGIVILTGVLRRNYIKYNNRGYRYLLIEAGHISQNIMLLAEELGMVTCPVGGFVDDDLDELLDIKEQGEFSVYTIAVGNK